VVDQPAGFGPTILLIGGFIWLTRRTAARLAVARIGIGRSRAKRYDEAQDTSFSASRSPT
jgi:hypothetical protein